VPVVEPQGAHGRHGDGASVQPPTRLARRLGVTDAVTVGLGSMVGAGVFAAVAPAAAAAGSGLLLGLVLAAIVAFGNATSSAQLAAVHPESGGTYIYGHRQLGPFWGFLAGWSFVVGKSASCAAMALTAAAYAVPGALRPTAAVVVVALTLVNLGGVTRTAAATRVMLVGVLIVLVLVVVATLAGGRADPDNLGSLTSGGLGGTLQSAGLLFFAFAGYARIATLGEEVVDPERTIPRAIPIALGIALAIYVVVLTSALLAAGPDRLAGAADPLAVAVRLGNLSELAPVVRVGGALAATGVLLSLLAGVGRTAFAMGSNGDLPRWLGAVHPHHRIPHRAEAAVGTVVALGVLLVDLREAIGFSSFTVLTYYAVANASSWTLPPEQRRWPRWLSVLGLAGCVLLAFALPLASVVGGLLVLAVGAAAWSARRRLRLRPGAGSAVAP
jgi:APA family basic amino acid/polyamine antiporter